ncbi:MAG: acetate kinase, partial [Pseudomonadota bacterium]
MAILVLNAGSSSLKTAVFERGRRVLEARVSAIGAAPELTLGAERRPLAKEIDHAGALSACLSALRETSAAAIDAVAHRVVHGGDLFDAPQRLDRAAMARLESLNALAPLHNPTALAVIRAAEAALPAAAQIACFDTAFHARQPEVARRFAIPDREATAGLTRYGFHGLSYQSLLERLNPIPPRLLACHLGAGASLCAIRGGMSVATTMGYSPLDGLTMGTRSGAMDPSAALELARRVGVDEAETLLTRESGLLGLSGAPSHVSCARSVRPVHARCAAIAP